MSGAALGRNGGRTHSRIRAGSSPAQGRLWDEPPPDRSVAIDAARERRGSAALQRYAFEQADDALVVVDQERWVTHANACAVRLLGLGKGARLPRAVPASEGPLHALSRGVDVALRGGSVRGLGWRLQGGSGSERQGVLHCAPLRDESGRVRGVGCSLRELSHGEDAAAGAAVLVEGARLVHEFNNVLTVVLGSLSMASEELQGPAAELVLAAQEAALGAKVLTEDLSRRIRQAAAESDGPHESAAAGCGWAAGGLQLSTAVWAAVQGLGPRRALSLAQRFGLVALRLAGPDTPVSVQTGVATHGDVAQFEVVAIWQGGWAVQGDSVARALSRLQRPLDRLGGRADAVLRERRAEIRLVLPFTARLEGQGGAGRILLMDDDQTVRQVAARILRASHYEVAQAVDGQAALALFHKARGANRPFHLVLLDLTVPDGMGGEEAGRHLLEIDPGLPILISTGRPDGMSQLDVQRLGFRGVVPKPYTASELRAGVEQALRGARSSA